LLRSFWLSQAFTQKQVKQLIERMEQVEKLNLKPSQYVEIFAPRKTN